MPARSAGETVPVSVNPFIEPMVCVCPTGRFRISFFLTFIASPNSFGLSYKTPLTTPDIISWPSSVLCSFCFNKAMLFCILGMELRAGGNSASVFFNLLSATNLSFLKFFSERFSLSTCLLTFILLMVSGSPESIAVMLSASISSSCFMLLTSPIAPLLIWLINLPFLSIKSYL